MKRIIRRYYLIFYIPASLFLFQGCFTYKNSALFQDATAPPNVTGDSVEPELRIRPNDLVRLTILTPDTKLNQLWTFPEGVWVDQKGNIKMPLLGTIPVKGLTIEAFEDTLYGRLQRFTSRPYVQVQYLSFEVYVMGEVSMPGKKLLMREKGTVIDALAEAGPFTDVTDIRHVKVLRKKPDGHVETYHLDMRSKDIFHARGFHLKPGDIVYMPPSRRGILAKNMAALSGVYVIAQVLLLLLSRL